MFSFKNFLIEMPIKNMALQGSWDNNKQQGYDQASIGILTSEKGRNKIIEKFSNGNIDFELIFLKGKQKYNQLGEVSQEWVKEKLGINVEPKGNAITIIFTNNFGNNKMPLNYWIIAHRISHAASFNQKNSILTNAVFRDCIKILKELYGVNKSNYNTKYYYYDEYEKELKALFYAIGTMQSAKNRNLNTIYEFVHEITAQWLLTNEIKFNPLPKRLQLNNKKAWGRDNFNYIHAKYLDDINIYNEELEYNADYYCNLLSSIYGKFYNKILLM